MMNHSRRNARNRAKTYTRRTPRPGPGYAVGRKSLLHIMGLRGVEPLTSRLSGTPDEGGLTAVHSGILTVSTARRFRNEHSKGHKSAIGAYTARTRESGRRARIAARFALVLATATAAPSCVHRASVQTFDAPTCPAGWSFLYVDRTVEHGGTIERAVCRRDGGL